MAKIDRLLAGLWVCLLLAAVPAAPTAAAMPDAMLTVAVDYTDGQHPPEDLEHTTFALRDDAGAYLTAELEQDGVYRCTGWTADLKGATALVAGADGSISVTGLSAGDYGLLQTEGVDGYDLLRESPIRLEEGQTNQVTVRIPPELELPDLYPTHRIWALALLSVGLLIFILALVLHARR